jgi:hypothetical protein
LAMGSLLPVAVSRYSRAPGGMEPPSISFQVTAEDRP